jgi:hypothetical protein
MSDELEKITTRMLELEAALMPFGEAYFDAGGPGTPDSLSVSQTNAAECIGVHNLRRAAELLHLMPDDKVTG